MRRLALGLALTLLSPAAVLAAPTPVVQSQLTERSVRDCYASLRAELNQLPNDPAAWIAFVSRWNAFKATLSGENSRRSLCESQNTNDPEAEKAAVFMREKIAPIQEEGDAVIRQALLSSPFRPQMEAHFGKLLFLNFEVSQSAFEPKNIQLNTQIANLTAKYGKVVATAKVQVDGETLTMPKALALWEDPSEGKRKAAWEAVNEWTYAHADELQGIYSELVKKRHQMALNLGEENFVPVGYKRMQRTDYGPEDVKRFRAEIKRYVVPLLYRFRKHQAELLGQKTVKPWNMKYYPGLSLDPHVLQVDHEVDEAQRLFDRLHPHLGQRFQTMREEHLIDLENRPGKVPGAYCTNFDDTKKAFIFCNSTGGADDVGTLTHEMGHAFQMWDSFWIEPIELRWPTYEACEIDSMGMEYLTLPLLDEFFKPEDVRKYRKLKLIDTLTLLPYVATVDEYQHWVYEHPQNTPEERDEAWSRIWDSYNVGLDWTGVEKAKAVRWKRQNHIFQDPFYYIDYAIAEAGALQLFQLDQTDHGKAMDCYLKLCRIGGSQSLLQIFQEGGLKSPFSPGLFADLMETIAKELEI